jgi:hypothetical protein
MKTLTLLFLFGLDIMSTLCAQLQKQFHMNVTIKNGIQNGTAFLKVIFFNICTAKNRLTVVAN